MRASIRVLLLALLAATALVLPRAAAAQEDLARAHDPFAPVYLVSSRATYDSSLRGLVRDADERRDSVGRPVVVSRAQTHRLEDISRRVHEHERRCGGYFAFPTRAAAEDFLRNDLTALSMQAQVAQYTIDQPQRVATWFDQVEEPRIRATIDHLSTAWPNRLYASKHGRDSAVWIRDTWLALGQGRPDVSAELFTTCFNCGVQPSVILTVQGNQLADEVVVLGGHLDSISSTGWGDAMIAPGADDDASGIAVLTEIIRIALADGWKPRRTIKFMGYAAEEVGLRGSRAIAESFRAQGVDVVGVLQLDMTNYNTGLALDMRLVTDFSNAPLQQFVVDLFDTYLAPSGMTRGTSTCGYACSDHASWTATGYPSAFVMEPVLFPARHTPNDTLPITGPTAATSVAFAQLGLAFVAELGKRGVPPPPLPFCPPLPMPGTDPEPTMLTSPVVREDGLPRGPRRARFPLGGLHR